jgi:uncharacterized protein
MTWMDHGFALAFAVLGPVWGYFVYASFKQRVRAGFPCARLAAYARGIVEQWLVVAVAIALWIHRDRDWTSIGLTAPDSLEGGLALGVAVLAGGFLFLQAATVARRPETHEKVRGSMISMVEMLPVQRSDLTGFMAVSITAGVCEEILFRGFLAWYFTDALGFWGAHAASVILFGAGHAFLGASGAVRALLVGGLFAALYMWCGSLVPSMILHVLVDMTSGWMAYEVLRERSVQSLEPDLGAS